MRTYADGAIGSGTGCQSPAYIIRGAAQAHNVYRSLYTNADRMLYYDKKDYKERDVWITC